MSEDDNWQSYRSELNTCLSSATPCIPYLGQFLTQVCHQLSYNKLKEEVQVVQSLPSPSSFLPLSLGKERSEEVQLRRRSRSFHGSTPHIVEVKRASTASLSAPTSPAGSDGEEDEDENSTRRQSVRISQVYRTGTSDSQSIEFSLPLDNRALGSSSPLPQGEESLDTSESSLNSKSSGEKAAMATHSTPGSTLHIFSEEQMKISRESSFEERSSLMIAFDEPDLGNECLTDPFLRASDVHSNTSGTDATYRMKIPSISLQQNSSQSSLEYWEESQERQKTRKGSRILKSRSLESHLDKCTADESDSEARHSLRSNPGPIAHQLSISHSIPSLDSDSVFSTEEQDVDETENRKTSDRDKDEEDSLLTFSMESELGSLHSEISKNNANCSQNLYVRSNKLLSTADEDSQNSRESSFSPVDNSTTNSRNKKDRKLSSRIVHRSRSVGSGTYRHKWRWKKAVALATSDSSKTSPQIKTDPLSLLSLFQARSRACYPSAASISKKDFKTLFLEKLSHNTESKNYELSLEREP